MNTVTVKSDTSLVFEQAQELANTEARKYLKDPMTLSWLDRILDRHFPNVDCCQEDGKESWEIYAESRGGDVRVEVGEWYVFIFREGSIAN
ncbi:MAG: AF1514 family protein [Chloroflexi bacterium]|nr:AF1514 family protein [Chloroflexota bacterium]